MNAVTFLSNLLANAKYDDILQYYWDEQYFELLIQKEPDNVNWTKLCKNLYMSEEFFEKYIDQLDWKSISTNINMSMAFFDKYFDKLDKTVLWTNKNLTVDFVECHIKKVDWFYLSECSMFSSNFFRKHKNKINIIAYLNNPNLDMKLVEELDIDWQKTFIGSYVDLSYSDRVIGIENMESVALSCNKTMTMDIYNKYKDKIDSRSFCQYNNLASDCNDINWHQLSFNRYLNGEFIRQNLHNFEKNNATVGIMQYSKLPLDIIYYFDDVKNLSCNQYVWEAIYRELNGQTITPKLQLNSQRLLNQLVKYGWCGDMLTNYWDEAFIEQFMANKHGLGTITCWSHVALNPNLSMNFFNKYFQCVSPVIWCNHALTEEFVERHIQDDVDWMRLSRNPAMTTDFFRRHKDSLDIQSYIMNPAIDMDFLEELNVDWKEIKAIGHHLDITRLTNKFSYDELSKLYGFHSNKYLPYEVFKQYQHKKCKTCYNSPHLERYINELSGFNKRYLKYIVTNQYLSKNFVRKYANDIKADYNCLKNFISNTTVSFELLKECYLIDDYFTTECSNEMIWKALRHSITL